MGDSNDDPNDPHDAPDDAPDGQPPDDRHWIARSLSGLTWPFWMLCTIEMWERLAYFGMRVVVGIYIAQADEPGGLHFTQEDRGTIFAWWFIFQSVLPTFTGGFADRYGYKQTLFVSITLKIVGYVLMATQTSYPGFFLGMVLLAVGTAIFKPALQGSLAQNLTRANSSAGWGIFYWLVNVGAMLGPPLAGWLRQISWPWVFYGCAIIVSLNYLMLLTYKEQESGYDAKDDAWKVFVVTVKNLVDARLVAYLAISAGFWLMMYQLWDLHPLFITDWIDTSAIADLPLVPEIWTHDTDDPLWFVPPFLVAGSDRGVQVLQENMLNLNAALIVVFVIPMSVVVARMRSLSAQLIGMIIATAGIVVSGSTMSGWVFLLGVACFSFGEMLTGPKINEYLGLIAPPGKKALYLGYANVPVGVGGFIGSKMAGWLYGNYGEKAVLAQRYLAEKTDFLAERGLSWNGEVETLGESLGIDRTFAYDYLRLYLDRSGAEVTQLLWDTYQPYLIWYPFAAIGALSVIGLVIYNLRARSWGVMNA